MSVQSYISKLSSGKSLNVSEAQDCALQIIEGRVQSAEISEILVQMAGRGESIDEIVGFAFAMRNSMIRVPAHGDFLDVCGTGGSGKSRFNVSTAVAFVLSACGISVAKHGNRGSTQANGSFDFLEALGIKFELSPEKSAELLKNEHLCFLFARQYHLGVRNAAEARQKVGRRTIFNLVGPLCNPAGAKFQIIGTTSIRIGEKIAAAVQRLGCQRAMVVIGGDGADEVSLTETSTVFHVTPDSIELFYLDPKSVGFEFEADDLEIIGGDAKKNAEVFLQFIAAPDIESPIGALIAINAALALWCVGRVSNLEDGIALLKKLYLSGAIAKKFENYKKAATL